MTSNSWGGVRGIVEHAVNQTSDSLPPEIDNLAKTGIANIASNMHRAKQPALLVEDGATFHASIKPVPGGQLQATCHAELDKKSSLVMESPVYGIFNSKREAHIWVHQHAAARNFPSILWADEFSADVG